MKKGFFRMLSIIMIKRGFDLSGFLLNFNENRRLGMRRILVCVFAIKKNCIANNYDTSYMIK